MKLLISLMFFQLIVGSAVAAGDTEKKDFKGGLDKGVIDGQIRKHILQIRLCYEKELLASAKPFSGRISTHFVIGSEGKVTAAEVSSTSINNSKVESCVIEVEKSILFPNPVGGGNVEVDYPFSFQPSLKKRKQFKEPGKNEDQSA